MNMQTNDARFAEMLAQGMFSRSELIVQGDTRQYVMHYKMPATDVPGTVDDWEIRAIVQNGRAASLFTSPAVPRLLKLSEERSAHKWHSWTAWLRMPSLVLQLVAPWEHWGRE